MLRRVAATNAVPLVDVHGAMLEASGEHLPGFDLFVDYVHFNPKGPDVAAAAMEQGLTEEGLIDDLAGLRAE